MVRYIVRALIGLSSVAFFLFAVNTLTMTGSRLRWMTALLASENGHWFALLAVVLAVQGLRKKRWREPFGWMPPVLLVVSAVILARPFYKAANEEEKWRREFETEFGVTAAEPWFSSWKAWSFDLTPPEFERRRVVGTDGTEIAYDLYRGEGQGPRPVVIVVHGGGWDSGDSRQLPHLNGVLMKRGYSVASVDYRLAPEWKWPKQRDDVETVLKDLQTNASSLSLDVSGFYMLGRSAGGQIAGAASYVNPIVCVKGLVSYYAPTDLKFGYEVASPDDWLQGMTLIVQLMGGTPYELPGPYQASSLTENVALQNPPTLLIHGRPDSLTWYKHSERLHKRLKAAGAKSYFLDLPWGHHGFDFFTRGPGGQVSTNAVVAFFESQKNRCR